MQLYKLLKVLALGGLTLTPLRAEAAPQNPQPAGTAAKRPPRPKQKPARAQQTARLAQVDLFKTPERSATWPLLSPTLLREPPPAAAPSRRRPILTMEGILLGDYYLVPNLILVTDNRYDDANTRERALREELNYQDARRHGDVHEDPLTQLLRKRVFRLGGDPGFRIALVVQHFLQGALQPPVRSLEMVLRPDGLAYNPTVASSASGLGTSAGMFSFLGISRQSADKRLGSNRSPSFSSSGEK